MATCGGVQWAKGTSVVDVGPEAGLLLGLPHGGDAHGGLDVVGGVGRVVLVVDPAAGEDPHAAGELQLGVAAQHQGLEPRRAVPQEDDGGRRDGLGDLVPGLAQGAGQRCPSAISPGTG